MRKRLKLVAVLVIALTVFMGMSLTVFADGSKGGIKVRSEYSANFYGVMCVLVEVENTNPFDTSVTMNAISMNANGKKIESDAANDILFMNPGDVYMLVAVLPNSAKATNYDYDLIVDTKHDFYDPVAAGDDVDAKASDDGRGNVTIYATNKASSVVEARGMVVFYNKGTIVDFQEAYLSNDADCLMSPGESTTETVCTDAAYDSIALYVTAVK